MLLMASGEGQITKAANPSPWPQVSDEHGLRGGTQCWSQNRRERKATLFSLDLMTFRMLRGLSASSRQAQISRDTDVSNLAHSINKIRPGIRADLRARSRDVSAGRRACAHCEIVAERSCH
jgi:hypothetical protein